MNKQGWLVNDCLTCIPGTKTLWHDLLEWIPNLIDKTNGYTDFSVLADSIESQLKHHKPDYIIRNASFFRPIETEVYTISLLQDPVNSKIQIDVCDRSDLVVFNSQYTYEKSIKFLNIKNHKIIPIGTDFEFFRPLNKDFKDELDILDNSVLFIGANNQYKGFDKLVDVINKSHLNFCLVMKDSTNITTKNCRTFNRVGHETLIKIINSCSRCVCLSNTETLHLSSVEAGACDIPVITTNVGIHYNKNPDGWGEIIDFNCTTIDIINILYNSLDKNYNTRCKFLDFGYDKISCRNSWKSLI
jgi:glycosyltransferase involved in cell wall biosynthesis